MTKEELQKIVNALPDGCNVNIDITPVAPKEQSKERKIFKWKDLKNINGYWINGNSDIEDIVHDDAHPINRNIFATEAQAKSALAMAQLSQLIPHYCKPFTNEEWLNRNLPKYTIYRDRGQSVVREQYGFYHFLAFRTMEQAELFFQNNKELIKQYYMLD